MNHRGSGGAPVLPARGLPALFTVLVIVGFVAGDAYAHGILQRSSPRANAVLPSLPHEILLEFNEEIDPRFSFLELIAPEGEIIARGGAVSSDARRLRLPTGDQGQGGRGRGVYVVRWRVLSAVDGHTAAGSFLFAVGDETALAAASGSAPSALPPAVLVVARWCSYLGALLLAGVVMFDAVAVRWAIRQIDPAAAVVAGRPVAALRRLRVTAALLTFGALGFELLAQAADVIGAGIGQILRREVLASLLVQTKVGWSLLLRAYAAGLLLLSEGPAARLLRAAGVIWLVVFTAVVTLLGGPGALSSSHVTLIVLVGSVYGLASLLAAGIVPEVRDVHIPQWRGASVAAAGVLLAGFTLSSHAAGRGVVLAVFDWLHLVGATVWVGGLPALLVALRAAPSDVREGVGRLLVPRVSAAAGVSLLVMILTGLAAARTLVGSLANLASAAYGRALLVKLVLVAGLVVLGAVNRFVYRPRIAARTPGALGRFRLSVALEVALGAAILLTVAALTIMPPASVTGDRPAGQGIRYAGIIQGERILVRLTPGAAGINELVIQGPPASVRVRSLLTLDDTPVRPDGTLELQDGWWEIVVATSRGEVVFPLAIGAPPEESDPAATQLLARARGEMSRVRTWREIEQISDGSGGVVETVFEVARPDRLRYRTSSGAEAVIIGAVRYSRDPGTGWTRDQLAQPVSPDGPYVSFLEGAAGVRFGAEDRCGAEACRIVLWELPSAQARFAARIGASGRLYRISMVAPAHYMTSRADRLNDPLRIVPP